MSECIGIDDVMRDLMMVSSQLGNRAEEMTDKLADIGMKDMDGFHHPQGQYDFNDSVVSKRKLKSGTVLSAKGSKVAFIEFGAGSATTKPSESNFDGPEFAMGDWSMTHGTGELFRSMKHNGPNGYWHHNGVKYNFQPAERYAFSAQKSILANIESLSKGLFKP